MTAIRQNIGRVGLRLRNEWTANPQEPYAKMDVVSKDGSSYMSLVDNNTTTPPSESWQVQSQRGEVGHGVNEGGSAGQVLTKKSGTDYDTEWKTPVDAYSKTEVDNITAPFITKSVNDLTNYYLKSETYTRAEVQSLIAAIQQFHYEIYASISAVTTPAGNVLYLIGPTGSGSDKYEEYVYDSTKQEPWIKIGDTSLDLSGYVTTTALNTALADYTTTAALTLLLAGKQDALVFETAPSSSNKVATMADMPTQMGASGSGHKGGLVPDTPSTAGTTKFLREDGTWEVPAGGGGAAYTPTLNSAPTSSTTTYTKDGQTVNFEIGQFCRVAVTGGYDFYQLYDLNNGVSSWEKVENIHADHEDIYITVTLAADAPQGATVSGLVINAYFNDASVPTVQVTTDNNGMVALSVPNGYKYEIVFPVQQGCREIAPVVHTATLYQRSVEVEYAAATEEGEVVTVQALNKDAQVYSVLAGVTISCTYDGTTTQYTTGSDGKATFVVPYGKTYTVTAGAVEGKYVRNQAARTFTAESSVRSVTYIYSLFTSGLFVVDSGGGEYRLDEWQDAVEGGTKQNSDAKMIKVATNALANAGGIFYVGIDMLRERTGVLTGQQWASQNVEFKSIPLNGNSSSAAYYYDGLTASMLIKSEGEERGIFTPAATNALLATFELNANEIKHGFLGSVGQWNVLWSNKEEVDDILLYTRPNGTYLLSTYTANKWTATQNVANTAYCWSSSATNYYKDYSFVVVPFFA